MRRILVLLLGAGLPLFVALGARAQPAPAVPTLLGPWLTQDREAVIRVEPCGPKLCGRIVGTTWNRATGHPPVDRQGQPQCGLVIMQGFTERSRGTWDGTITNPDDGKVYDAQIQLDQAGRLRMRGYVLIPLLGQTQLWTRYGPPLTPDCRMVPG